MENGQKLQVDLSIIIKTLNEERNIARCIEAILNSLRSSSIEIIVADSGSSDRTVEIASNYPVTIVQLANTAERSCGIGPQLGFQHSKGNFVLILDADMVLHGEFVHVALARMKADARCAGIGGQLVERSGSGYEYELRCAMANSQEEEVNWLDGGGLYRREAILSVGYLSNRNLHAYEEKELGLRLTNAGWHIFRVADVAVDHYGHSIDTVKLLWRRWRSGYAAACGESIRACLGKPYLWDMVMVHKSHVMILLLQISLFSALLIYPWYPLPLIWVAVIFLLGFFGQIIRKKSFANGIHSLLHLNVFAIGLARGLFRRQIDPKISVRSVVIKSI